jgi:uncharacterized membrane protein
MNDEQEKNDDIQIDKSYGLSTDRIQSLNDNIFAFAMTILVLGFQLPGTIVKHQLGYVLYNLRPELITYALSFLALGGLWIAHHNQYYWIKRSNRAFLWINILYLFFIVLIPFSTKLLATYDTDQLAVVVFGLNLIICLAILYLHWAYATKKQRLTDSDVNSHIVGLLQARITFVIVIILIAIGISFVSVEVSILLFLIAQFSSMVSTRSIHTFIVWSRRMLGLKNTQAQ